MTDRRGDIHHPLELALENLNDGLFLVDIEDRIAYANAALPRLLHTTTKQLNGMTYTTLFKKIAEMASDPQKTERELNFGLRKLDQQPVLYPLMRNLPNGRFQIRLFPITCEDDGFVRWGCMIRDVTDEWKTITEHTDYLAMLIDTLWRPIVSVKGALSMLLSKGQLLDNGERQKRLTSICHDMESISEGLGYTQLLLKLETDEASINLAPHSLQDLLDQVIGHMGTRTKIYHFAMELSPDLPSIELDFQRMEQIFYVLLDNLMKYSSIGNEIRIGAHVEENEMLIDIADPGLEIPYDQVPHLFEPFHQATSQNSIQFAEFGLGLHMVRRLVLLHGGRIWAEAQPSSGTIIHIGLPISSSHVLQPITQSSGTKKVGVNRHSLKALLVDDDPDMALFLKRILENEGYQVTCVDKGRSAIESTVIKNPDIILMDMYLPDINGLDACAQIREFSTVPIIIVTASLKREDAARALDVGADDYISKPVHRMELLARIRANIRRRSVADPVNTAQTFHTRDLEINFSQHQVTIRGEAIKLSRIEYKLLCYLAVNAGHVVSHTQMLSKIWGPEYKEDIQYLWVTISRLRKKLENDPNNPEYIVTEAGIGYCLPIPDSEAALPVSGGRVIY